MTDEIPILYKSMITAATQCKKMTIKKLQEENEQLRDKINAIFDDLDLIENREDLWKLINLLVDNEIEQEKFCGE